jgi:hypothetical protein
MCGCGWVCGCGCVGVGVGVQSAQVTQLAASVINLKLLSERMISKSCCAAKVICYFIIPAFYLSFLLTSLALINQLST